MNKKLVNMVEEEREFKEEFNRKIDDILVEPISDLFVVGLAGSGFLAGACYYFASNSGYIKVAKNYISSLF